MILESDMKHLLNTKVEITLTNEGVYRGILHQHNISNATLTGLSIDDSNNKEIVLRYKNIRAFPLSNVKELKRA